MWNEHKDDIIHIIYWNPIIWKGVGWLGKHPIKKLFSKLAVKWSRVQNVNPYFAIGVFNFLQQNI